MPKKSIKTDIRNTSKKIDGFDAVDFDHMTMDQFARGMHVTRQTTDNWVRKGLPRNKDKTLVFADVVKWLVEDRVNGGRLRSDKKSSKTKDDVDIALKEAREELVRVQIEKAREDVMPREEHVNILRAREKAFALFWEKSAVKNAIFYEGKTRQELITLRLREAREALDAFCGRI